MMRTIVQHEVSPDVWGKTLARFPGGKMTETVATERRPPKGWADRLAAVFGLPRVLSWGRNGARSGAAWFAAQTSLDVACADALADALDAMDYSDNGDPKIASFCAENVRMVEGKAIVLTSYSYDDGEVDVWEIRRQKEELDAARADGWKKILAAADAVDGLPCCTIAGQKDFLSFPARWVVKASSSDDGYRSDGAGGQYYAGQAKSAYSVRSEHLELAPGWRDLWERAKNPSSVADATAEIIAALGGNPSEKAKAAIAEIFAAQAAAQAAAKAAIQAAEQARLDEKAAQEAECKRLSGLYSKQLGAFAPVMRCGNGDYAVWTGHYYATPCADGWMSDDGNKLSDSDVRSELVLNKSSLECYK